MWRKIGLDLFVSRSKNAVLKGCILLLGVGAAGSYPPLKAQQPITVEQLSHICLEQISQGNFQAAVLPCQTAIELARATGSPRLEGYGSGNLGTAYLHLQQYQAAVEQFQQTIDIAVEIDDSILKARALVAVGSAYMKLEQSQQAIASYQEALRLAEQTNYPTGVAVAAYNLGLAYDALDQPQQAMSFYRQMLQVAQSIRDPILEGYAWSKLTSNQTAQP